MSPDIFTALGAASAIFLSAAGSCYASAHSGVFAIRNHSILGLKSLIPIVQSGVLAIYGLIIALILIHRFNGAAAISESDGFRYLAAGLLAGCSSLWSGVGIGLLIKTLHNGYHAPRLLRHLHLHLQMIRGSWNHCCLIHTSFRLLLFLTKNPLKP
jgi:V-type H+-transporting ATPase proteolipid subunit